MAKKVPQLSAPMEFVCPTMLKRRLVTNKAEMDELTGVHALCQFCHSNSDDCNFGLVPVAA